VRKRSNVMQDTPNNFRVSLPKLTEPFQACLPSLMLWLQQNSNTGLWMSSQGENMII
jgi:hypothetical protein